MNAILLTAAFLALFVPSNAQFNLAYNGDCTGGRLLDPFLVQALKSKYPKKFATKLDLRKELGFEKYRQLAAAKLLAKHMKNLSFLNNDFQNLMLQQQSQAMIQQPQAMMQQQMVVPDQAALLPQQPNCLGNHNLQIPFGDAQRISFQPQVEAQLTPCQNVLDQRFQQSPFQLNAAQSNCFNQECPCSCEEEDDDDGIVRRSKVIPNSVSSIFSSCLGVLKNILK